MKWGKKTWQFQGALEDEARGCLPKSPRDLFQLHFLIRKKKMFEMISTSKKAVCVSCACFFRNLDGMIISTSSTPSKVPHRQVPRYAPWRIFDWLQSHRLEPFPKFQANRLEENWVSSWAVKKIAQKNGRHKTNIFSDSSRYNKKTTLSEIKKKTAGFHTIGSMFTEDPTSQPFQGGSLLS